MALKVSYIIDKAVDFEKWLELRSIPLIIRLTEARRVIVTTPFLSLLRNGNTVYTKHQLTSGECDNLENAIVNLSNGFFSFNWVRDPNAYSHAIPTIFDISKEFIARLKEGLEKCSSQSEESQPSPGSTGESSASPTTNSNEIKDTSSKPRRKPTPALAV